MKTSLNTSRRSLFFLSPLYVPDLSVISLWARTWIGWCKENAILSMISWNLVLPTQPLRLNPTHTNEKIWKKQFLVFSFTVCLFSFWTLSLFSICVSLSMLSASPPKSFPEVWTLLKPHVLHFFDIFFNLLSLQRTLGRVLSSTGCALGPICAYMYGVSCTVLVHLLKS